ncbi:MULTISPECIES: ABC transporter ATP-binding protein [Clostridium]|uniref:ABC transporter ATP-binding protein YxlF n=3 Tax=Clostridium TaxID=1485 RepID=D8GNA1_CLOLD|nr:MULTISPECIES: ABC transporter ATP-binding protein [Clostridium]ADK13725.1 predicted ABC transporter, ATPase component [Clostridium ljungdahlii DSM 13528]AGY76952.1 ABC transporter ATP-binding protein [Clostridium autoethanogenum DSM 10061]ALU37095.1 ABC-type transporter ATP-binding domain [Clostridium autoethanogenum DSM 10061]OAA83726.1 putative ABC transporter ATP-binding protein YxlF [Clostridium ljungdahlii DSM 13528]OVY48549.1 putative ABC transporter ATP-binding protein YxlF [Clostrid
MDDILKTYNLTKEFKHFCAVKNLNIHIKKGDIYGFLGQNGAGKTTTIRMIMGLIKPTSGEIELFSEKTSNRKVLERIGSMIEYPGFYPNLTAGENLEIHRRMMGVQGKNCIDETLKVVGISDVKNKKVKEFSLGMKQRLGIARALLHHPEFLILDEPTNGLDPIGIKEIRELIIDLCKKQGITFLISSHILSEVQQMANKIGIIHKGELLEEISYDELQRRNRHYINIKVNNDKKASFILEEKLGIKDYVIWGKNNFRVYEKLQEISNINKALVSNDLLVDEICLKVDSLEDYFIKLTGGN